MGFFFPFKLLQVKLITENDGIHERNKWYSFCAGREQH